MLQANGKWLKIQNSCLHCVVSLVTGIWQLAIKNWIGLVSKKPRPSTANELLQG
jgi:hypothetical protein